ncbi:OmpP1/FadL family transporter [Vibrio methylphosphonaticus]|uniref:OmpP1/FadL family transporter n=1 Tax=Vibrio methylphosphonaticus TaxID=2946866 RepID=UPI00202A0F9E|nr:outer membrane protein transport protein [Vibrio methylphosphonaticus]MCL9774801.1 outer membrane protein transport protein [Vibrio methylphosphonaticus]
MKVNLTTLSLLLAGAVIPCVQAGGLNLSQIATAKSVGTAGAGNITTNDASAVITNAANLSEIEESAWILGVQYLNVESNFVRDDNSASSTGTNQQVLPHLSFASRLNDKWVAGIALHADGGVGIKYSQGVGATPYELINENSISALNLTTSLAYQINDQLSLGSSLILQHASLKAQGLKGRELKGDSLATGFGLSANYQVSEDTQFGIRYQSQFDHDLSFDSNNDLRISPNLTWVKSLGLGVRQSVTQNLDLLVSTNMEGWQDYDEKYSTTYSVGVGVEYVYDDWLLYSGVSGDTSPVSSQNRDVLLPLDAQWRIGLGAERKVSHDLHLGLSYQYQNLGDGEIDANSGLFQPSGRYDTNRVHFITLSLRY